MKYFTLAWYRRIHDWENDATENDRAVFQRYTRHLEEMQSVLPAEILALARLRGVDDGLVVEVHHDREARVLTLALRCGDGQMGYYDLCLRYQDAAIASWDEWTLARTRTASIRWAGLR